MVQLPGVNTTQFGWVLNRLPNKPKPLGAVYQPEVAAEAIHWAAHHRRRELYVGLPAVQAIVSNKVAPGFLDRYLGRNGYEGQQTSEPKDPAMENNLWAPLTGDHGAHGAFDAQAKRRSPQLWIAKNKRSLGVLIGCAAAIAGLLLIGDRLNR
jgi:hypothetical protein